MLKELIARYGKDKINTLTKYPSILTFHKLGKNQILTNELTFSYEICLKVLSKLLCELIFTVIFLIIFNYFT